MECSPGQIMPTMALLVPMAPTHPAPSHAEAAGNMSASRAACVANDKVPHEDCMSSKGRSRADSGMPTESGAEAYAGAAAMSPKNRDIPDAVTPPTAILSVAHRELHSSRLSSA